MPTTINDIKLKKCNVNSVKCKRINVNGVKVWTAEEKFSKQITNTYHNNGGHWTYDENGNVNGWVSDSHDYSAFSVGSIDIPVGDTFRIDSLIAQCPNSSDTEIVLIVNGTTILNVNPPGNATTTYGAYPSASGIYTSSKATGTIQFKIRGKVSASQWDSSPTVPLIINYTTGV